VWQSGFETGLPHATLSVQASGVQTMLAKEFLYFKTAVPAAMASMRLTGVPASITLAQGALESAWGLSDLAQEANNYFGIKATQGEDYAEFPTTECVHDVKEHVLAKFAKYVSVADAYAAHAHLLSAIPRYAPAMAVRHDPAQFALELQNCGYSTSEDEHGNKIYASQLMQLVKEFNLTQYDIEPEPPAQAQSKAA